MAEPGRGALVVVDVQQGFAEAAHWGRRNNPACEQNVAALIAHWRAHGGPVVFVRHDSVEAGSPLRPGLPGNAFRDEITGEPDLLVSKSVHSAFHGTPDLHAWLREHGLDTVVICGITTNHCCETTARVGSDLGHQVIFVLDATHTFDRVHPDGSVITADDLARTTAANLDREFARVVSTAQVLTDPGLSPRSRSGGAADATVPAPTS